MKRKGLLLSIAASVLLAPLVFHGTGAAVKTNPAFTNEVSIDGLTFRSDDSPPGDASLLFRELARLGVPSPDPSEVTGPPRDAHPVFSGKVSGAAEANPAGIRGIPRGLAAEHTLRMSGGGRTVELAVGRIEGDAEKVVPRLEAAGWKPLSVGGDPRSPRMLQLSMDKETTVVCMDEKEGCFLFLRRLAR